MKSYFFKFQLQIKSIICIYYKYVTNLLSVLKRYYQWRYMIKTDHSFIFISSNFIVELPEKSENVEILHGYLHMK